MQNSQENVCPWAYFFNKVVGLRPTTLLKEALIKVFSYEFWKTLKNIYFEEHLWTLLIADWMENHIEIEPQRFATFTLSCLH